MKWKEPISVVIPFYNELTLLPITLREVDEFLKNNFSSYEIIIVDDGHNNSITRYALLASKMYGYKKMSVVDYEGNKGKGFAIKAGLYNRNYDLALILDADLSCKPNNILEFMKLYSKELDKSLLVCGQRNQVISQGKLRLFLGKSFRKLVMTTLNIKMKDTQCPYKVINKINKENISKMFIDGFAYDLELIKVAQLNKFKIIKQEVDYFNDDRSSIRLKHIIKMGYDILRIKIKY